MQTFQILIVEDFEPFRRFVGTTLQQRAEFHVAEASDGLEAVRKTEQLQPDLILLDIGLPYLNGIEVAKCASNIAPSAKIVLLSQESSPEVVREALSAGAQGYVQKLRAGCDLMRSIDAALKGGSFVSTANGTPREWKYSWQQKVMDAFQASLKSLPAKISIAERAIAARLADPNQWDKEELLALKRALRSLASLIAETKPQPGASEKEDIA